MNYLFVIITSVSLIQLLHRTMKGIQIPGKYRNSIWRAVNDGYWHIVLWFLNSRAVAPWASNSPPEALNVVSLGWLRRLCQIVVSFEAVNLLREDYNKRLQ